MSRTCHGVLVIDDDHDTREAIEQALENNDFAVTGVADGEAALARLRSEAPPCVILLDVLMPGMDGPAFRAAQLADPRLASIPVIVLTAHFTGDRIAAELRADGYLAKPCDLATLLDMVGLFCKR